MMAILVMNNSITALMYDIGGAAEDFPGLREQILEGQAILIESALKASIASEGLVDTGELRDSIGHIDRRYRTETRIGPSGVHHRKMSRSGRVYELRNGHLGYVHEYGAPGRGIRPKKWMSKTVTRMSGKALESAEAAIDQYLKKHNL